VIRDIVKGFQNTTIGIVGMGYIGKHLFQTLTPYSADFNIKIHCFNRKTVKQIGKFELDYLFNCAGNTGDFRSQILETVESNISLAIFLLKNARVKTCLIPLSTTRIYGFTNDANLYFDENYLNTEPHTAQDFIYNGSKKLMESVYLNHKTPYKIAIPRLSNVFGKFKKSELDKSTFLKLMLEAAINGETISTHQALESAKDYIFIDDAIEGILRTALFSEDKNCYNIALGKSYSIEDWAKFLKISIKSNSDTPPPESIGMFHKYSRVLKEKAAEKLGFSPRYDLSTLQFSDVLS
jgi:nucleoside-diphosphate-sugar epimerase